MFLQVLYEYAQRNRLLENLPLQGRIIHALVPVHSDGRLRFDHLVPLTRTDEKEKERPGQERLMPRFPGENNGGKTLRKRFLLVIQSSVIRRKAVILQKPFSISGIRLRKLIMKPGISGWVHYYRFVQSTWLNMMAK
jgi:hypothetical protein